MKRLLVIFLLLLIPQIAVAKDKDIEIINEEGIYHIILKGNKIKKHIKFVQNDELITNKEAHKKFNSKLTINAGFFDMKTQQTISYIVTDKETTANPALNTGLTGSAELKPYLDKILNRSELRIIKKHRKYYYEIAPHDKPIEEGCEIITSAQAGPQILPDLNMEEEFFLVRKENRVVRQSAAVLFKVPRTIVGIKDNDLHILIITRQNPKSMTDVWILCKNLGFESAMGFDGGGSTSLNYKDIDVVSEKYPYGRKVKSFMIVEK